MRLIIDIDFLGHPMNPSVTEESWSAGLGKLIDWFLRSGLLLLLQ